MLSGKLFQSLIVWGKKLFWKYVVDVDGEYAMCNESMWRADNVVEF